MGKTILTASWNKKALEIRKKLSLDTIGTIEVLDERLGELEFEELRLLMKMYECELSELTDHIWNADIKFIVRINKGKTR